MRTKIAIAAVLLCSCSSVKTLNSSSSAVTGPDPSGEQTNLLYEHQKRGNIDVAYHIDHYRMGNVAGGYRLTLLFKNAGADPLEVKPSVVVLDDDGIVLNPSSYEQYVQGASSMAGTPIPAMPAPPSGVTRFSGNYYNDQTGGYGTFSGTSRC